MHSKCSVNASCQNKLLPFLAVGPVGSSGQGLPNRGEMLRGQDSKGLLTGEWGGAAWSY